VVVRSRPRSTRLLVVVLVSISLATITLDYRQGEAGPLSGLGRAALGVMAPLQEAVSRVTRPAGDFFTALAELPELRRRNEDLQTQLQEAQARNAEVASVQQSYDELLALTKLAEKVDPKPIYAVVIANAPTNTGWSITINAGSSEGVREGMAVVGAAGLVGHVSRVATNAADVELIIDRDSSVAARLVNAQEAGMLTGQGDADLRMDLVSSSTQIQVGSEVVETSGYHTSLGGGLYPPGIPIGTVSRVFQAPSGLDQYVTVRPAVDFSSLRFVKVLHTGDAE
jgi:rod shape-determining protein MreC